MHKCRLGKTDLLVSRIGIGTGTSGFSGHIVQAAMDREELAAILLYGLEKGINFWDTAYNYGTYGHIRTALDEIRRGEVVICSKFTDASYSVVKRSIEKTLEELGTEYLDIALLHGVRNPFELKMRRGAVRAIVEMKRKGFVRCAGISSHGLGALIASVEAPWVDVVYGRVNCSGIHMDSYQEDLLSKLVAVPALRRIGKALVPKRFIPSLSSAIEPEFADGSEQKKALETFERLYRGGKAVVAMKVLGIGSLAWRIDDALGYALGLECISSALIGIRCREEIDGLIEAYEGLFGAGLVVEGKGDYEHTGTTCG